jgi:hypothetical protein
MNLSRRRGWFWFFGLFLPAILFLSGCGSGSKGTITGKVYYGKQLVRGGRVTFMNAAGKGAASSEISKDGTYTISKIPVGEVQIGVETESIKRKGDVRQSKPPEGMEGPSRSGGWMTPEEAKERYTWIPTKYSDPKESGLTYTVKSGNQEYDLKLPEENLPAAQNSP